MMLDTKTCRNPRHGRKGLGLKYDLQMLIRLLVLIAEA